ncbi:MAG: hypothetical protein DHS20C18_23700 [Saprospiraceae bacterium]|nr:MAG: hypothetical protein DHS20C18_23700 [Saprospiraceae bacterium]
MEKLISTIIWAAIVQGVFLAGLYLFSKKHKSLSNRLLGLFLLTIIYEGTLAFLPFDAILGYPIYYYFSLPEVKLFYPLLFLHYILEKVGRTWRYRNVLRIHYILAFAIVGVSFINVLLFAFTGQKLEGYLGKPLTETFFMAQQYYAFILIIAALIVAVKEVAHYKQVVLKEYSDNAMLSINWLWQFIFGVLPIVLLWGAELIRILLGGKNESDFIVAIWGSVVIFIYFVSFQAFKHKNLFEGVPEGSADKMLKKEKPQNAKPEQQQDHKLIQQIMSHMEKNEPFLDASLSMHQLAKQLNMPVRELSLLINHTLNKHFFDFVNEYRIKKAMEILSNPQNNKMTVLEILYEVGFNSKSSFNTVFKKYTGKTPTQYREARSLV